MTAWCLRLPFSIRRAAGAVGLIVVCLAIGGMAGKALAPGAPPPPPPPVHQNCLALPPPHNSTVQCSDQAGLSCDPCEHPETLERSCPNRCMCVARCSFGSHAKPQDDGGEGLFASTCLEHGEWSQAYTTTEEACLDIDECSSNPCQNGGECFATQPVRADSYLCVCQPGTSGENCETDIDECGMPNSVTYPCQNSGTCYESGASSRDNPGAVPTALGEIGLGEYKCDCTSSSPAPQQTCGATPSAHYSGDNCDAPCDACASSPCLNDATCTNLPRVAFLTSPPFSCSCAGGYAGPNCGEDSDASYLTRTDSQSVARASDTGEELLATGKVDLNDDDLQFFDDDTCDSSTGVGTDACLQAIGVIFKNVTIQGTHARAGVPAMGTAPVGDVVRSATIALKIKEIPDAVSGVADLNLCVQMMTVLNAPDMTDTDHGISQATAPSCPNPANCFYNSCPTAWPLAAGAVADSTAVVWEVGPAHAVGDVLETGVGVDVASLLNLMVMRPAWVPGSSVMFKFTLIPPPPPAPPSFDPNTGRYTPLPPPLAKGLRVFEARKDGYPKLTYTQCTTYPCTPAAGSAGGKKAATCSLSDLSIAHNKAPSCHYNGTAVTIGPGQMAVPAPGDDDPYTTSCTIQCCDGYAPADSKSFQYRCSSAGAWRDDHDGDVDVTCEEENECDLIHPCTNGECSMPDKSGITETDDDQCKIVPKTNGHIWICDCDGTDFTGDRCESQTNECASSPCHHGSSCTDGNAEYTCACVAGYNGGNCVDDIDECASSPCQNGGLCHDSSSKTDQTIAPDAFACGCTGDYQGHSCETDQDNCASCPCQNGGTCHSALNAFSCNCVAGYRGDACGQDIDECSSHPCQNDGTCSDSSSDPKVAIDSFGCACKGSYTGVTCATEDDVCKSAPCTNDGTCTTDVDGAGSVIFVCDCGHHGHGGPTCADDSMCNAADQSTISCQNGGTCMDDSTDHEGYSCDCGSSGYNGARCETNTDDCDGDKNTCKNGNADDGSLKADGTCVDAVNAVTCTCHAGFSGDTCETDNKVCSHDPSPCQNGGTCTDDTSVVDGYTCACAGTFTGVTCGNAADFCSPGPCQNAAVCSNGDAAATCACVSGTPTAGDICATCVAGKQANADQTACENCPAGKYGSAGTCTSCADGTEPAPSRTACVACAVGKATKSRGSGICGTCDPGHEPMPVGSNVTAQPAARGCQACSGNMHSTDGLTCEACGAGKHPHADKSTCEDCGNDEAGENGLCTACAAGKQPNGPNTKCIGCGADKFSANGSPCASCPDGQTVNHDKSGCDGGR